ncbi:MAG: TolC family protein, partial [Gammaproteobacteria bacterium]
FQAEQAYSVLVGEQRIAAEHEEPLQTLTSIDNHPRLAAAQSAIEYAQAQLHTVNESRRDSPELTLGTRRERLDENEPYENTLRIGVRLPLATEARNQPLIAAAQTALTQTQGDYDLVRRHLAVEIKQTEQGYQMTQQALAITEAQQRLTAENVMLLQKSFDLGELSLVLLLQAKNSAFSAEQAYTQQKIALALSKARLNQAQGISP